MKKTLALTLFALFLPSTVLGAGLRLAQAGSVADCVAREILASNDGKGIDPKLAHLRSHFERPPFSGWNSFQLLAERSIKAQQSSAASAPLLPPGKLTLKLHDKVVARGKSRIRIDVKIDYKKRKNLVSTLLVFDGGKTLFPVAGMPYKKGTYVLALACK